MIGGGALVDRSAASPALVAARRRKTTKFEDSIISRHRHQDQHRVRLDGRRRRQHRRQFARERLQPRRPRQHRHRRSRPDRRSRGVPRLRPRRAGRGNPEGRAQEGSAAPGNLSQAARDPRPAQQAVGVRDRRGRALLGVAADRAKSGRRRSALGRQLDPEQSDVRRGRRRGCRGRGRCGRRRRRPPQTRRRRRRRAEREGRGGARSDSACRDVRERHRRYRRRARFQARRGNLDLAVVGTARPKSPIDILAGASARSRSPRRAHGMRHAALERGAATRRTAAAAGAADRRAAALAAKACRHIEADRRWRTTSTSRSTTREKPAPMRPGRRRSRRRATAAARAVARPSAGGDRSRQARPVVRSASARRSKIRRRRCSTASGTTPRPSSISPRPIRKWATSKARARSCRKCCTRATTSRNPKRSRCSRSSADRISTTRTRAAEPNPPPVSLCVEHRKHVDVVHAHRPRTRIRGHRVHGLAIAAGRARRAGRARARARRDRRSTPCATIAAGRTDAGVHATMQIVHFDTDVERPATAWVRGVNAHLPPTSRCCGRGRGSAAEFHARFAATARHYTYLLARSARCGRRSSPAASAGTIGRSTSTRCARPRGALVGTHDFSAFRAAECQAKSPVKTLSTIDDRRRRRSSSASISRANAFLHHMIRNIVGALVYVGAGKQARDWIADLLAARDRTRAAPTFAPDGLYLTGADYDARGACRRRGARLRCRSHDGARDTRCARASRSAASPASRTALAAARRGRRRDRPRLLGRARRACVDRRARARDRATRCRRSCRSSALFVDPEPAQVRRCLPRCRSTSCNSTATKPPEFCRAFGRPYVKAVPVAQGARRRFARIRGAVCRTPRGSCSMRRRRAGCRAARGGRSTGACCRGELPRPLILSGGLDAANVGEAIRRVRPWAVDVSSGVEARRRRRTPDQGHQGSRADRRVHRGSAPCRCTDLPRSSDARGHFGPYGGVFVAETLIRALDELQGAVRALPRTIPAFVAEFEYELAHYVGRPSPVYHAKRWSEQVGGAQIWLKREDLNHTGAHKINNCIGQALLARRLGKPRVIAETGAGQHGVADGDGRRALRHGMRRLHGLGGRAAPGAERLPHEAAGRDGRAGRIGLEDAEGRAERGDARLGHQRREDVLHHRHRRRPASVPDDGARLPERDRRRVPRRRCRKPRAASPTR